jgi:hypothetical protein
VGHFDKILLLAGVGAAAIVTLQRVVIFVGTHLVSIFCGMLAL